MRFLFRLLLTFVLTLGALLIAAAALLLLVEFRLPLDAQREAIAAALSQSLGAEVRITGPLWLISGGRPGVEIGGLRIAGTLKGRQLSADVDLARVRLGVRALLAREIRLSEVSAEGAKLCVPTASGASTAERTPSARPDSALRPTDIDTLRIEVAALHAGPDCAALPGSVELRTFTLSASGGEALRVIASGTLAGEVWKLDLHGPALPALADLSAPLPFKLAAETADGKLSAQGKLLLSPVSAEADVAFDSPQFASHLRPLGAPFKDFGPLALRAHVRADANLLTVRLDEARLVPVVASGEFSYDWSGPRPRIAARARTHRLDTAELQRWLTQSIDAERVQPGNLQRLVIAGMRASDGSLVVEARQIEAGRAAFEAVLIDASWREGKARASFGARLGRAPIKGTFDADVRSDELALAATAAAAGVALPDGLGTGIAATAANIDAKLSARGRLGRELGEGVRAAVEVRDAALALPRKGGDKLSITLDTMHADWQARDTLRVAAAGTVFGERYDVRFEGADALHLFRGEPWQLSASGAYGPLHLATKGNLALGKGSPLAQLDVAAAADGLGSLVPEAIAKLPLDVRGRVELTQAAWRVDLASLRLGKTQGRVQANGSVPFAARPLSAQALFDVLDLASLAGDAGDGELWERPWLPSRLALPDADITLRAARVLAPGGVIAKVEADAKTRNGRLEQAPFALSIDGAAIRGNLSADLRQDAAQVSATMDASGLDKFVVGERAADGSIRVSMGSAKLTAAATGNRLRELAATAELAIQVRDAHAQIERPGRGPQLEATLSQAALAAGPGRTTQLTMSGKFAGLALAAEASAQPLAAWLPPGRAPFAYSLSGQVAGLTVVAKGQVPLAGAAGEAAFDVRISAERLDALNASLPAEGPFALEAATRKSAAGELAADIKIALGESRMTGRVAGRNIADRPAFEIDLTSPLLRLEDLGAQALAEPGELRKDAKVDPSRQAVTKEVQHAQALLDELHRGLRKFDARVQLALQRITAGGTDVGRLDAVATLESGRLRLAPVRYDGALGGSADVALDADMASDDARYRLAVTVDHLHYGQLVKSIDPGHDAAGELGLKLKLSGHGALAAIAHTLEGDAGLIVFPSGQPSSWMDKLGGGLLRNLGTNLDVEKSSKLNCAVVTLDFARGRAKSAALMLDSTRTRAAGELEIDLGSGVLQGQLAPKSKRPELFSTGVPLEIRGTLADPKVGPMAGALALGAARYYYFAYAYLFDAVTTKQLAEDGRPDCVAAYERLAK